MKAFLTGSRKYGLPNEDSDIDIVIRADENLAALLIAEQELDGIVVDQKANYPPGRVQVKFGKLNLLVCTTDLAYREWLEGTEILTSESPVSRERAIEVLTAIRQKVSP